MSIAILIVAIGFLLLMLDYRKLNDEYKTKSQGYTRKT